MQHKQELFFQCKGMHQGGWGWGVNVLHAVKNQSEPNSKRFGSLNERGTQKQMVSVGNTLYKLTLATALNVFSWSADVSIKTQE